MKYSCILVNTCVVAAYINSSNGYPDTAVQMRHLMVPHYSTTMLRRADSSDRQGSPGSRQEDRASPSRNHRSKTFTVQGTPRSGKVSGYAAVRGPGSIVSQGFQPIEVPPGKNHVHTVHSSHALKMEATADGVPPANAATQPERDRAIRLKAYGPTVQGSAEIPPDGRGSYKLDAPGKYIYDQLGPGKYGFRQHKTPDSGEAMMSIELDRGGKASATATKP